MFRRRKTRTKVSGGDWSPFNTITATETKVVSSLFLGDVVLETATESVEPEAPVELKSRVAGELRQLGLNKWSALRYALISAVLAVSTCLAIDTWLVNRQLSAALSVVAEEEEVVAEEGGTEPTEEEEDTSPEAAESQSASAAAGGVATAVGSNTVGRIRIPAVGVNARILSGGVDRQGSIKSPGNNQDTMWYNGSARLGEAGAAFINGHAGVRAPAVFTRIAQLRVGDTIIIERSDGVSLTYVVKSVKTATAAEVSMREALAPYQGASKGLTLMTCAGDYSSQAGTYDKRTVVFAVLE
jgi:LPXTG-site transpeptidase (sortase) family protein